MISTKRIGWLNRLIERRFGMSFRLVLQNGYWQISIPGLSQSIRMPFLDTRYPLGTSDISCEWIDAERVNLPLKLFSPLVAPGGSIARGEILHFDNDGAVLDIDLPTMMWWVLSRAEEVMRPEKDQHDRFPAKSSHAWYNRYLERPVIDEWLEVLRAIVMRVWPELPIKRPVYSLQLGHDVDQPSRYTFRPFLKAFKHLCGDIWHRRWSSVRSAPFAWMSKKKLHPCDPYNTFDLLMKHAEACGVQSRFHFFMGRTDFQFDADYSPEDPLIISLAMQIRERGHLLGLHPSYGTYNDSSALLQEVDRFQNIFGENEVHSRMHYLRWKHPDTLRNLARSGVTHDYSLGYADAIGFRCGTCFSYEAFDPIDDTAVPVVLTPLLAMDVTFLSNAYSDRSLREHRQTLFKLIDSCRNVGGCFSLLWHNSQLNTPEKCKLLLQLSDYATP